MDGRTLKRSIEIGGLVFAAAILVFAVSQAVRLPIYPDEVAYKYFLERFFAAGQVKQSLTPYCAEGFLVHIGPILWPAAAFWTFIHGLRAGWISYRIVPVVVLAATFGAVIFSGIRAGRWGVWMPLLLVALGPAIYGLVVLRPEILILGFAVAIFFVGRTMSRSASPLVIGIGIVALLVLFSLIAYVHPKAIYLAVPVAVAIVLSAWRLEGWLIPLGVIAAGVVATTLILRSALLLHQLQFLVCPEIPEIASKMVVQSINPADLVSNPARFFAGLWHSFDNEILGRTFDQLGYQLKPDISYLPAVETPRLIERTLNSAVPVVVAGFIIAAIARFLWLLVRGTSQVRRETALVAAFGIALLAPMLLNLSRNWYELSGAVAAVGLVSALLWSMGTPSRWPLVRYAAAGLAIVLLAMGAASQFAIHRDYTTEFEQGYEGPGIDASTDFDTVRRRVDAMIDRNGLDGVEALAVDDYTYDALSGRRLVVPVTYLGLARRHEGVLRQALARLDVAWGITRCANMMESATLLEAVTLERDAGPAPRYDLCLFSIGGKEGP